MTDYAPGQLTVALSGSSGLVGTRGYAKHSLQQAIR